ncbi:cache domain-containing sensor histidine kinase [Cohnella zeiphila]|uniref:histidine kinase n=1 Tax=Cohnella zeiphila TaxID=2761120 RepID=A0A7X0VZV1_9BACL|nr:sensor histidine kinase [Cohnella zeiphila]MBB6734348.1 sensor histidine kinase [Cohnella zeiphila]
MNGIGRLLFFRRSIQAKMALSFMAVCLVPLVLLGWASYSWYAHLVENRTAEYNAKLMSTFTTDMDQFLVQVEQFSYTVYQDNFQALWKDSLNANDFEKIRDQLGMNELFLRQEEFYNFRGIVQAVTLLDGKGAVFYENKETVKPDYRFGGEIWLRMLQSGDAGDWLLGPYLTQPWLPDNLAPSGEQADDFKLTYIRKVSDLQRPQTILGYIMLHFSLKEVQKFLLPLMSDSSGSMMIVDRNAGTIVYDTDVGLIGQAVPAGIGKPESGGKGYRITSEKGRKYLVTSASLRSVDWDVYCKNDLAALLADSRRMRTITLLFVAASFALAILAAQFLSAGLVTPIKRLKNAMLKVSQGYLGVQANRLSQDEIGELGRYFNEMIGRIKYLIEQVYRAELHEREAKLNALQAQINPHFLYNTLETINSMAAVEGVRKVGDIARALSDMFRYSIKAGGIQVDVADEIGHIRNYLKIVSVRFEDKLTFGLEIPEELLRYKMIKLVFQPLVENAVFHGIETKRGRGEVRIEARKEDGDLIFIIRDDGTGMTEEQLASLRRRLADSSATGTSEAGAGKVGVKNVHDRLRFYYGDPYGISLDSRPGAGTLVTVRIPASLE